jgi:hypothetical protein
VLDHGERVTTGRLEAAAPTLVRLTATRPRVAEGDHVAFRAEVVTVRREGPAPSGTVAFRAGHRLLGTAPLDGKGSAVLDGIRLPAGVHAVVASYGGDAAHAAASSSPVPQAVVAPAAPVVVALAVPERRPAGVALQADILDAATGRIVEEAEGLVTFALDGQLVGSAPLVGGVAVLVLPELPVGRISAQFRGDAEHAAAEGTRPAAGAA